MGASTASQTRHKKKKNYPRRTREDRVFDIVSTVILILIMLIVLWPLYIVLISSVSDPDAVNAGKVVIVPVGFTWTGYVSIFNDSEVWIGYRNSILYTVIGTALAVVMTMLAAYPLTRKDLPGRNIFMGLFVFTMYFNGGTIPLFILVNKLNLYNTPLIIILITAFSAYNLIIARTFIQSTIPPELLEAARMDGCGNWTFFIKIVVPLSSAIIAVLAVFYGVVYWNSYYWALLFIVDTKYQPLQIVLRQILNATKSVVPVTDLASFEYNQELKRHAELIKYCMIVVASVPFLIVYPFAQKYFVKGVMIGSIKG